MQLYEVWFQLHFNDLVDVGRAIVCAEDQTKAKETVIGLLDLPVAALTHCDVKRIKPNLFLLERHDVVKPRGTSTLEFETDRPDKPAALKGLKAIANRLGQNREYRREMDEYVSQQKWAAEFGGRREEIEYECRVMAVVKAEDEDTALRRLAGALRERSFGVVDNSRYVTNVIIDLTPE